MKSFLGPSLLKNTITICLFFIIPTFVETYCKDFSNSAGYCTHHLTTFWQFAIESNRNIEQMIRQHLIQSVLINLIISYIISSAFIFILRIFLKKYRK